MAIPSVSASNAAFSQLPPQTPARPKQANVPAGQTSAQNQTNSPVPTTAASYVAAAVDEATESNFQTAQEANNGDLEAQRLLQREAAAAQANRPTVNTSGQVTGKIVNTTA